MPLTQHQIESINKKPKNKEEAKEIKLFKMILNGYRKIKTRRKRKATKD